MTLSLRGRLLIGVISLVVVGLLIPDVATYATLQSSLMNRIDEQLKQASTVATARAVLASPSCMPRGRLPGDFPGGTIWVLIASDGTIVNACGVAGPGATSASP